MKHILNNLSEEEKNSIREQHTGGINLYTDRFKTLMESKLGDAKPLLAEQVTDELEKGLRQVLSGISVMTTDANVNDVNKVYYYCKNSKVSKQPNTDKVAKEIHQRLSGMDNPLNVMGGGSVADTAKIILYNIKGATQLCSLLKYYKDSSGGENFYDAIYDDTMGKLDTVSPIGKLTDTFRRVVDMKS
jgi:hypothetical protein